MYKNYFFLYRQVAEANELLEGYEIISAFSQEKDKLILTLSHNNILKYLEISANPSLPYFNLKDTFHRAKKNSISFFKEYLPAKIISFEIAFFDRIIKIKLNTASLYFVIKGKETNFFLFNKANNLSSFKKRNLKVEENELDQMPFSNTVKLPEIVLEGEEDFFDNLKIKYPFIGREIILETELRCNENSGLSKIKILQQIIEETFTERPAVFYDEGLNEYLIGISSFRSLQRKEVKIFDNIFPALSYYLNKKYSTDSAVDKRKKWEKYIRRESGKITSKLNNLKSRIDKGSNEVEYNKLANLILINLHSIRKGIKEIELNDIYTNQPVTIKLNPEFSSRENADYYFEKARTEKINYKKSVELYNQCRKKFDYYKELEQRLNESAEENLADLLKELKVKDMQTDLPKNDLTDKFKQYVIENKYKLFVGRDSKNNDLLTVKFARQNDFWFHARSVPGSHVVLKVDNSKEAVPKNILKKAASIAAYHSKAKTSGLVPVSYTQKKYVVKKKGMEPGKVALLKEEVLLVKPEIPSGCEYIY
jgi:predicted ribosome quality control (RQC) complex YloA/Tae2 family protein